MLEGREYDQAEVTHSIEIMREVNKANTALDGASATTANVAKGL